MVSKVGLEPTCRMAQEPKSCASANSATPTKMVPRTGVEPVWINQRILSPLRLPFRHPGSLVREVRFELTTYCSQSNRANQTALLPDII